MATFNRKNPGKLTLPLLKSIMIAGIFLAGIMGSVSARNLLIKNGNTMPLNEQGTSVTMMDLNFPPGGGNLELTDYSIIPGQPIEITFIQEQARRVIFTIVSDQGDLYFSEAGFWDPGVVQFAVSSHEMEPGMSYKVTATVINGDNAETWFFFGNGEF